MTCTMTKHSSWFRAAKEAFDLIWFLVGFHSLFEAKESDLEPSVAGTYFKRQLQIPYFHVVQDFNGIEASPEEKYVVAAPWLLSLLR